MEDKYNKNIRMIGILIDAIGNAYNYKIISGIQDAVGKYGYNIIYFSNIKVREYMETGSCANIIFKLISREIIDSLIIFPDIFNFSTKEQTGDFLQKFASIPFILISYEYKGYPHIHADNRSGLRELITHIIENHGKKKLAFIKGIEGTYDSQERFNVYREVLNEHNLPFREDLVTHGFYLIQSGKDAVRTFIEERKLRPEVDFDAIIAVNDTTAVGAIEMLAEYGVKVPETISVCGFDDWYLGQMLETPLSTVTQCVEKIGSEAVRLVCENTSIPQNNEVPTRMVIRKSCGCNMKAAVYSDDPGRIMSYEEIREKHTQERDELISRMAETIAFSSINEETAKKISIRLIDSFPLIFTDQTGNVFISEFGSILSSVCIDYTYLELFNTAFTLLKDWLLKTFGIPALTYKLKSILDQLSVMLRIKLEKTALENYFEFEHYVNSLRYMTDAIAQNLEMDQFLDKITECLTRLEFRHFYFFLYDKPGVYTSDFRLILSNTSGARDPIAAEKSLYPDFYSITGNLLKKQPPFSFCLLPIAYRESRFGFLILSKPENPHTYIAYETISTQIDSTMKNITLMTELRNAYEKQEEDSLELQAAYEKLKTTQKSLFQSEKMAAVGQLAGGVAHEINNPMGVILGFAQSIGKRIREDDPLYMPLKSIEREAMRCKKLVGDLLTFSITEKTRTEQADINETIESALTIIAAQAKTGNIDIIKTFGESLPRITLYRNQIQQVIVNLCNNAMDAIRGNLSAGKKAAADAVADAAAIEDRKIFITTGLIGDHVEIKISDTGMGMTDDVKKHLFEPFYTTKEVGKGTGLGLSICYEIVKRHNGNIEVESETGKGAVFTITLPIDWKESA